MTYYEDERPQVGRLRLAAVEAVRNNLEEFGERHFQEFVGASKTSLVQAQPDPRAALEERRHLEQEIRRLEGKMKDLQRDAAALKSESARVQELYKRQTERAEKFKSAYERLKQSPEYAAGRLVRRPLTAPRSIARRIQKSADKVLPGQAQKALAAAPAPAEPPAPAQPPAPSEVSVPVPPAASAPTPAANPASPAGAPPTPSTKPAITSSAGAATPSTARAAVLLKELQTRFFKEGMVREVEASLTPLLQEHPGLPGAASFAATIAGWSALMDNDPLVPPRQPNIGYFPEKNRVLYCAHSTGRFNSNGYSTRTAGLTHALVTAGQDVTVIARPGYPWDAKTQGVLPRSRRTEMRVDSVNHVFNPGLSLSGQPIDEYIACAADVYVREAVRFRAAVIHAASNHVTALPALIAARRLGIPFVYEVRGLWEITEASTRPGWDQGDRFKTAVHLESLVAREADRVFAITRQVAQELVRRGVPEERITVVPNAADTGRFLPGNPDKQLQRKLGIAPDEQVIGYAGSLVEYEGIDDLLEAFAIVKQRRSTARLLIVGDGAALARLRSRATELGLGQAVVFTGRVRASDIPRYLSLFTIAPIPRRSIPVTEIVSPLKPLEALAAGIPLVLSDVAPLKDIAGDNEARGLLYAAGDVKALAGTLERLMGDRRLRGDLARRGRQWVAGERSWNAIAQDIMANYARLGAPAVPNARDIGGMRLGLIADEFTTGSIEPECTVVRISPENWEQEIRGIDALLVESAWEGNGGAWHRMVGHYDDDASATLRRLIAACRAASVPTIFWNKEDPVHIKRFLPNAALFDHVFTTDANCIPVYWKAKGAATKTVASLPFFAQPTLHAPLPSERAYSHTVAYGGSYYGDRYAVRSKQLKTLLDGVGADRVTIYDRQANNPDSPYSFPPELLKCVKGGLSYAEMNQAYRSHPVHINVNSVNDSPTMFSRRVMEVGASGTPLLTWIGPGISSTLGDSVPTVKNEREAQLLVDMWLNNEEIRLEDGWRVHRAVYRAHLAGHRLTMMLRTAGLAVVAPELPAFHVAIDSLDDAAADDVLRQSVYPKTVVAGSLPSTGAEQRLVRAGIGVRTAASLEQATQHMACIRLEPGADRTMAEDLVRSSVIAGGASVQRQESEMDAPGHGLLVPGPLDAKGSTLLAAGAAVGSYAMRRTNLADADAAAPAGQAASVPARAKGPSTVLIAGHDLKFAGSIVSHLETQGHNVLIDRWENHTKHDEALGRDLLGAADVVFCEWALGNVRWYAESKSPRQRLVTRFHLQELFTPYLSGPARENVDGFIFVGDLIRQAATVKFGLKPARTTVIPNYVDLQRLQQDRSHASAFNIGLVGIVPERKRLDLALDLIASLRERDTRYRLFIKGKRPEEYEWMASRPSEMAYYEEQYERINSDPLLRGAVQFDGHGDDMPEWFARMGAVLSVSDFESFHLTLPDGAAGGAVPLSLAWAGSELIYPESWLFETVPDMAASYADLVAKPLHYQNRQAETREFVARNFDSRKVLPRLTDYILGAGIDV